MPLRVRIGIELRALEFLDVLGGMFGYLRLKSGNTNILSETENLQRQSRSCDSVLCFGGSESSKI